MRLFMAASPMNISWDSISKLAAICFVAGALYTTIEMTNTELNKQDRKFTVAITEQTQSNKELAVALTSLNITMVALQGSFNASVEDIKEIKEVLIKHDGRIIFNHDDIIRLQAMPEH
jgi:hypothetical protein